MEETQIIDIIIYVLAAGLTASIFRYWKANGTALSVIKRTLLIMAAVFVVLIVALLGIVSSSSGVPLSETENIFAVLIRAMSLPYFSFFYFMFFIGIVYLLRERRRKKLDKKTKSKK